MEDKTETEVTTENLTKKELTPTIEKNLWQSISKIVKDRFRNFNFTGKIRNTHLPPEEIVKPDKTDSDSDQKSSWREQEMRSQSNTYEREKLRDLLTNIRHKVLRGEISHETAMAIEKDTQQLENRLDYLNHYLHMKNISPEEPLPKGVQLIKVNLPDVGEIGIRAVTLDSRTAEEKKNDIKPPIILITGWSADFKSTAAFEQLQALIGKRKLIGLSMPEHYTSVRPPGWDQKLRETRNYSIYGKVFTQAIKQLGLKEIDLQGYSAGGAATLALLEHQSQLPKEERLIINNVDIFNPTGFEGQNLFQLFYDFVIAQGIQAVSDEALRRRAMLVQRGISDFTNTGALTAAKEILPNQAFTADSLSKVAPFAKEIRIWAGEMDNVAPVKPIQKIFNEYIEETSKNPDESLSKTQNIRLIKGNGNHGSLISKAAYFADVAGNHLDVPDLIDVNDIPSSLADLLKRKYNLSEEPVVDYAEASV